MEYYHESIDTKDLTPAKIYISKYAGNNGHYPMHWHNHLEFDLVLDGVINGKINGKDFRVEKGDFFYANSGELHETQAENDEEMYSVTVLLSYKLLKGYFPDVDKYRFDLSKNETAKRKIKTLLYKCGYIYEEKSRFYELELSVALREICVVLLNECMVLKELESYNKFEKNNMINVKKAITYMEENYSNEITLSDIASHIGMAPTYFSRFFKKSTGETFYSYLNQIRLYNAYIELINSDNSITEIAMNNGFANIKSFIEYFKNVYELTPDKYRRYAKR